MSATATAVSSQPSSQQPPPPPTAESVLRLATRDPSAAAALLPALQPDAIDELLSSLSAASPANHLAILPRILSLSPSPTTAATFLSALLSAPSWPSATLLAITSLLRDLPAAYRARVPGFLTKVISLLPSADAQDLPALAYQLLLTAAKPLHPRAVLTGLVRFFGRGRVRAPPSIARQVEGTVLMHIAFAVKQDPALAKEVLAAVKADAAGALSGFAVAVLLSVARVRRFNEGAVGVLRDAVVLSRRDYRLSRRCKWLPDSLKEECAQAAHCVEKALLKAVDESIGGREQVVPSIVQVGFLLLEVSDGGDRGEEDGLDKEVMSTEDIGLNMLKSLFQIHEMARPAIIEQCKFCILSAKSQRSAPFLRLLASLICSHPIPLLDYIAHLKELLDYFVFMNDKMSGLISCILPLTKFSRDLKDYIILVVRKAMFKKDDMVRVAAINAIIELIIIENMYRKNDNPFEDSSRQPSSSQHTEMHLEFGGGLFQELSGLLRRCFSQQANVKEVLYEGLKQIVTSDPAVADSVLDFLWPHFQKYYTEDAERPLKIDSCFKVEDAKLCIAEPLDCLLSCISSILLVQQITKCERPSDSNWNCFGFAPSQDNEAGRASSRDFFMKALSIIQKYLTRSFIEDQQGQSQEAGSPSEMTLFHNFAMLGIIKVFVDFAASKLDRAADESNEMIEKEILELVGAHSSFKRKASNSRERNASRRANPSDNTDKHINDLKENSNASMQKLHEKRGRFVDSGLYQLAVLCVKQCNADSSNRYSQRPSQIKWNLDSSMVSLVLKACLELFKCHAAKECGDIIRSMKKMQDKSVKKLIQPVMKLLWCLMFNSDQENGVKRNMTQGKKSSENNKDQIYLALACLKDLLKTSDSVDYFGDITEAMIFSAPPNLDDMMDAGELLDKHDTGTVEDQSTRNAHMFLNILKKLHTRTLSQSLLRECEVVTELILHISRRLHPEQRYLVGNWAADLCKMKSVQSPGIAREVVKLAVHLAPAPNDMFLLYEMACELEKSVTSGDEDPRESSDAIHIINCKTRNSLATFFLQIVESSLTELEWGLAKLKAMLTLGYDVGNTGGDQPVDERMQRLDLEEALYSRSGLVVHVLSSFAHNTSLKDTQAEHFLKLTAKFYKLLTRMSKSQIAPKGYTQSIPEKFQKLAELTCRMLTGPLYDFVSSEQKLPNQQTSKKGTLAKIRRESKCIPDLIFQIEDYEKYLIQLSKLTKVNLLRRAKRSVARDFQIAPKEKSGEEQQEQNDAPPSAASPGKEPQKEQSDSPSFAASSGEPQNEQNDAPASSASSENEPDEDAEGPNPPPEANADEDIRSSAPVQGFESDEEDDEISAPRKRAKTNQIVPDSDEETEDE